MRSRTFAGLGAAVAVSLAIGFVLSLATTRVKNWFVMSDELYYERLVISVAHTGSLLPRIHGQVVSNLNQLYPVLLSPLYGDGNVPASFEAAHRLNAFLIASAAIPVYLLARRVGVAAWLAVAAGALSVAVPWIVLSAFLLTEVVAYPVFSWAVLALVQAVERKTWVWDAVALLAIAVAVLARTQFLVLLGVFLVAVLAEAVLTAAPREAATELWRTRRPFVLLYGALLAVMLVALATGNGSRLLGSYAVTAENMRVDLGLLKLAFAHAGTIALGVAIVPFVVGIGWLVDRIRPSAAASERAFALVGASAFVLLALQVASFTQRFGSGLVKDRYFFYVAPIVLIALAGAIGSRTWPRWWALAVPASVAAIGFLSIPLTPYEKLNVDTPVATLNDGLLELATSEVWARTMLVLLVAVVLQALLLARPFLPWRAVAAAVGALVAIALPLEAAYAFERLFRVNGTNGLPITLDQGIVFNWVDRNVGPTGRVTVAKYPVAGPDWWAGQAYWWDVEFWNESAVDVIADMSLRKTKHWSAMFDPRTGRYAGDTTTEYVLVYDEDVRFRLAGPQVTYDRDAYIFRPERPWRADWVVRGIYPDGWSFPNGRITLTIFPQPGQRTPLRRTIGVAGSTAEQQESREVSIVSNLERWRGSVAPGTSFDERIVVCVPPGTPTTVAIRSNGVSRVHRDPTKAALTGEIDRPTSFHLRTVALADETEPMGRCPA